MKNNIARQILAETSEEAKAKVKQYAKKAIAERLFDPNQYGNWLTGEPKATWGAGRDTSLPKRKYSKKQTNDTSSHNPNTGRTSKHCPR